jgi:hypothetical protein
MTLFHGTNIDFGEIDLAKSRPNKDFGQGFYLTADKDQAARMAAQKVLQTGGDSAVISYYFDESVLQEQTLNIKLFDNYSEEWAAFILLNRSRRTKEKQHNYDIVVGPIANDKVGVQLFRYMRDYIDLPTLVRKLQYIQITTQYYFGTERAIKLLHRL